MAQTPHYNATGFPSTVIAHDFNYNDALCVEDGVLNTTKTWTYTTDQTGTVLITPNIGNFFCIKGISIIGDGNSGTVKIQRGSDNTTIFPAYFSAQVKGSPSSAYNYILNVNESIKITTTGRTGSETFIGISYIEFNPNRE